MLKKHVILNFVLKHSVAPKSSPSDLHYMLWRPYKNLSGLTPYKQNLLTNQIRTTSITVPYNELPNRFLTKSIERVTLLIARSCLPPVRKPSIKSFKKHQTMLQEGNYTVLNR